jgi:hypothetical protein
MARAHSPAPGQADWAWVLGALIAALGGLIAWGVFVNRLANIAPADAAAAYGDAWGLRLAQLTTLGGGVAAVLLLTRLLGRAAAAWAAASGTLRGAFWLGGSLALVGGWVLLVGGALLGGLQEDGAFDYTRGYWAAVLLLAGQTQRLWAARGQLSQTERRNA